jgi:hypothetical protein
MPGIPKFKGQLVHSKGGQLAAFTFENKSLGD